MGINIELRPDLEVRLTEEASAQGMTVSSYLETVLDKNAAEAQSSQSALTAEEWSRELRQWAKEFPGQTPLLSDNAISRESIYDDEE